MRHRMEDVTSGVGGPTMLLHSIGVQSRVESAIMAAMDYDAELAKQAAEMNDAEDALVTAGFSEEHWMLIKQNVLAAILHNQIAVAKAWAGIGSD